MTSTQFTRGEGDYKNDTYTATRRCVECGTKHTTKVAAPAVFRWNQGALVQDAFPRMSASDRELYFQSGICDPCWKVLMAPPKDEDKTRRFRVSKDGPLL